MDEQEIELVRTSVRALLADDVGAPLPDRLRALGWDELREEDPAVAVGVLFEEQGRSLAVTRALDEIVTTTLGMEIDAEMVVAHPALTLVDRAPVAGGRLAGLVIGRLPPGTAVAAIAADGATTRWAKVGGPDLDSRPIDGFDPSLGLVSVTAEVPASGDIARGTWTAAVESARRALAHELIGVAEASLALAVEHVTGREQFGHPIAAFQSVRHRLADDYVAIIAARRAVDAAWREPGYISCAASKALAGRAALLTTRDAQQVCGAIGFTWEYPVHRYVRRAWMLDGLYGTAAEVERHIGEHLVATGRVPRVLPLG